MARVVIQNGPNRDQAFVLKGGELVGRDPSNEIQVFAPGVSRKHFQFTKENGAWIVLDLGSSNGTYVNNQRIKKHLLRNDDQITVGGINLKYVDEESTGHGSGRASPLSFSQEDVPLGAFGSSPGGFGGSPVPVSTPAPPPEEAGKVVLKEDDEEDAGEDYSLDASIIFDPSAALPTEDKVQALQKRLSLMFEISQALGEVHDLASLLEKILDKLLGIFPQADRGFVLIGDTVEELKPVVVRDRKKEGKAEVQMSRTIARKVCTEKQAIISQNAMEDDRFSGVVSIINFRILSMACAPLLYRSEVYGLIQLDTQDRAKKFTPDDLNLLAGIACQAAIFIKNLKLFESVRKEAEARANLERYFSPNVASQVASGKIDLKLGGDMKSGTVFFSDIIGFTTMSEGMTPADVVAKINRYMKYMVDIVFKYNGSVDKFIGDCIMAVWGVPLPIPDEAVSAVTAGVEMQNALFLFNGELRAEGQKPIHNGIGMNSGTFVSGNMGSEKRMEYTVIGDNVNMAQRVESKAGRGMVLVTDTTYERCGGKVLACKLLPVALKGKANMATTYVIRGVQQGGPNVYVTTLPCAINEWAEECDRGLLVKVKMLDENNVLGLVLFYERPPGPRVRLQFYPPELPRFHVDFEVQGDVKIQAPHGCCLKGTFSIQGTPFETLFREHVYVSDKSPEQMPRSSSPA